MKESKWKTETLREGLKEGPNDFIDRLERDAQRGEEDLVRLKAQRENLEGAGVLDAGKHEARAIPMQEEADRKYDEMMRSNFDVEVKKMGVINAKYGINGVGGGDEDTIRYAEYQLKEAEKANEILRQVAGNTEQQANNTDGIAESLNVPQGMQSGGWVGGSGPGDKIPAMLEPGEFVVNKNAASQFGGLLHAINVKKYAEGGSVGSPSISGGVMGGPKINFNIRGDSAKSILSEANKDLASALNDMMGGLNASARYYDLPKSG
jgi:hypothetical protein